MRSPICLAVGAAAALLGGAPAFAQEERRVTSAGPERVALTVYRAPSGRGAIRLPYVDGFAMVTETRRVRLPRGRVVLRFEGVAEGIVAVSAVITGLPGGTIEKNRDARLLSPASLVDGTLGRQVTITRTDKATGRRVSEDATIVAGPAEGLVLQTRTGVEALRCSGLPEKMTFAGVPAGLSSKPVLSVSTQSPAAREVMVQLTYLASGFDWRASYVAKQARHGRSLDLFAWLTLANANGQSFADAEVNAVAGTLNRVYTPRVRTAIADLRLVCYPLGTTTSDLRLKQERGQMEIIVTAARAPAAMAAMAPPAPPPPPPPPPPPEDLGDLKLYRVPERVSVSAQGQKQVALLAREGVRFARRYRLQVYPSQSLQVAPTTVVLVLANTEAAGLGLALPAGSTALYGEASDGTLQLMGLGSLTDRAKGETFRIAAGHSSQVLVTQTQTQPGAFLLTVTNANSFAVQADIAIGSPGGIVKAQGTHLPLVDGIRTWSPTIPPGGSAELRYRVERSGA
jgi:hypothetical protein